MDSENRRIVVFGIDGATPQILKPLINERKLPNLQRIIDKGCWGELESVHPPLTPAAWASLATGKNPGGHGIFGFNTAYTPFKGKFPRISSKFNDVKTLWDVLGYAGKKGIVFIYQYTYPTEKIKGIMVSGMGTPDNKGNFAYPKKIGVQLVKRFNYNPWLDAEQLRDKEIVFEKEKKSIEQIKNITKYLMEENEWDYLISVFMSADHIQHIFWNSIDEKHPEYSVDEAKKHGKKIAECYVEIDKAIGEILDYLDNETNIMVVSDHGFGPTYKRVILNKWLEKKGYLRYKKDAKTSNPRYWLKKTGVNQEKIKEVTTALGLKKYLKSVPSSIKEKIPSSRGKVYDIDWDKTLAYSNHNYGPIYLNKKTYQKSENILKALTEDLRNMKDPESNEKIVDKILKKEDIYQGKYTKWAPDLVVIPQISAYEMAPSAKTEEIFAAPLKPGSHRMKGVIIIGGPDIKKDKVEGAKITDVFPTVCELTGTPIPKEIDGVSLI